MKCQVCLGELRIGGSLAKDYGYCETCLKWRKLRDAIKEGEELTVMQRLAVLEAKVKALENERTVPGNEARDNERSSE